MIADAEVRRIARRAGVEPRVSWVRARGEAGCSRRKNIYTLEEVLAEKLRAVLGQRRFAVSRDLFDIHQLLGSGVDEARIRAALSAKLHVKSLDVATVSAERTLSRKRECQADWTRNLTPLVEPAALPAFEGA